MELLPLSKRLKTSTFACFVFVWHFVRRISTSEEENYWKMEENAGNGVASEVFTRRVGATEKRMRYVNAIYFLYLSNCVVGF